MARLLTPGTHFVDNCKQTKICKAQSSDKSEKLISFFGTNTLIHLKQLRAFEGSWGDGNLEIWGGGLWLQGRQIR